MGACFLKQYKGKSFQDNYYKIAPQRIPGRADCGVYDLGSERVTYHDRAENHGSGGLNPVDGTYLNEFTCTKAWSRSPVIEFGDNNSNHRIRAAVI